MINLLAYGFSFFIGFLLIRLILGKNNDLSFFLHCALSVGLGLGLCATTTFFFLLIYGQFHALGLISANAIVLITLLVINISTLPKITYTQPQEKFKQEILFTAAAIASWAIVTIIISILSQQFSFGGWDAWGLYNMKAKFMVFGGKNWTDIAKLHWHTQPSYPLLLPLINAWIFSFFQKNLIEVASLTGVIFSLSCGLLFYAGLSLLIRRSVALVAALLLVTTPTYIFWSTVQYADVLLAYYLLASAILFILTMRTLNVRMALLAGLFWGLMPFAKNEGIVLLALFIISTSLLLLSNKSYPKTQTRDLIKNLLVGSGLTFFANIIFKLFFAPTTREVLFNPLATKLPYCNLAGFLTTVSYYFKTLLGLGWIFVWILVGLMAVVNYKKWIMVKESRILVLVLGGFGLSLIYVYTTTAHCDLVWRLECTSTRISFYLLPSILFLSFYTLWTKTPKD